MAEYWKSTPKYWCKFCSIYVKDTKFERTQHEATGRHQGNIQRSLRGLHKQREIEQRRTQAAKDEVTRLNALVPGSSDASSSTAAKSDDARVGAKPTFTKQAKKQATMEDRKKQWNQLAAMGIAVPELMRGEMAMAGDWHVVSEKVIGEDEENKPLNVGVHKRKLDEADEEAQAAGEIITKKKGWGNTYKSFPGKMSGDEDNMEALFKQVKNKPKLNEDSNVGAGPEIKAESDGKEEDAKPGILDIPTEEEAMRKAFTKVDNISMMASSAETGVPAKAEAEDELVVPKVAFKKRKKIAR
ncbi:hypothetical protein CC78DRAFT_491218 [Lojkania enalia]|uniref:U1-type domain-containing protein n=1 Tax=Lojkania enalia TaxID=147567 RepID=A0A9P4KCQ1_9PLEO|nr:hypothetical protein CC78DRAFT_491218 [Didymosphaeria enalia]